MPEYTISLTPLAGKDSFITGRYCLESTKIQGILILNAIKPLKAKPAHENKHESHMGPTIVHNTTKTVEQYNNAYPKFQEATIKFVGTLSTQYNYNDVEFFNIESNISHSSDTNGLAPGEVCNSSSSPNSSSSWTWSILLKNNNDSEYSFNFQNHWHLPPSRKVNFLSPLKKGKKLLRISYNLHAIATFATTNGTLKLRCTVPVEPFQVWPSLKRGPTRNISLQILKPIGHRWSNILPIAQYDLSVSSTILGPGDKIVFNYRIVPRGHTCSNIFFKFIERYEMLDLKQLECPTNMSNNTLVERTIISWDYCSKFNRDYDSPTDELFNHHVDHFEIPNSPTINPTTMISELFLNENGVPLEPLTIPCDGMPSPKYGCVRHQIRIKITFNGAPSIRLECPVILLSVSTNSFRNILLSAKNKLPNTKSSNSNSTQPYITPIMSSDSPLIAHADAKFSYLPNTNNDVNTNDKVSKLGSSSSSTTESLLNAPSSQNATNESTTPCLDSDKISCSSSENGKIINPPTPAPNVNCQCSISTMSATPSTTTPTFKTLPTNVQPIEDHGTAIKQLVYQVETLKSENSKLLSAIVDINSKLNYLVRTLGSKDTIDPPKNDDITTHSITLENTLNSPSVTIEPEPRIPRNAIMGWEIPTAKKIVENRTMDYQEFTKTEINHMPMPSSVETYPDPINIKHPRPKFIRAMSNDFIYSKIPGTSIIKSALNVFGTSHGGNVTPNQNISANVPVPKVDIKKKKKKV